MKNLKVYKLIKDIAEEKKITEQSVHNYINEWLIERIEIVWPWKQTGYFIVDDFLVDMKKILIDKINEFFSWRPDRKINKKI